MPVRATLDSNILVYAELEPKQRKGIAAQRVIERAAANGVIANQAFLEFVAVIRRRLPTSLPSAIAKVEAWSQGFETAPTTSLIMSNALRLVNAHQFQVWDAVIWSAARAAGATVFLSEDLQDGMTLDGMRVVNPFSRSEAELRAPFSLKPRHQRSQPDASVAARHRIVQTIDDVKWQSSTAQFGPLQASQNSNFLESPRS